MPPKPRVISKIDQDLEDYLANLAQNAKVEQYNMNTAKMREVEWKRNLFPNVLVTAEQLLAQQQSIITAPLQPIVADPDVLNNVDYDVEKITTLQNLVSFGLSPQQADDLLKSIEHRGGAEFRSNGIYRLNGLWAGLKLELSKNFKDGATIPLVSSYIVDEFLAKKHPSTKPTRTEKLFEALDEPLDENVEENLQAHIAEKRAKHAFQSIRQAAADHKEEKLDAKRDDVRERGDKQAKKYRILQELKTKAIEATREREEEQRKRDEAEAEMQRKVKLAEDRRVASEKRSAKKVAIAQPAVHQVAQNASQLLEGARTLNAAKTIVKNYIDQHVQTIIKRGHENKFFTNQMNPRTSSLKSVEQCVSFLAEAMQVVNEPGRNLTQEFEQAAKPVGTGLKKVRLDEKALQKNVLSVRYNSSRLYKVKPISISPTVREIIGELHEGKKLDHRLFGRLTDAEQRHIELYINAMGSAKEHKITNRASRDLYEQFEICRGEIAAGNNNPKIKAKLRQIVADMVDCGFMPHKQGIRILTQLNA